MPHHASLVGKIVAGRYRVVQLIGSGGVGDVYLAEPQQGDARKRIALKVLRAEHRGHPDTVRRFVREAEAAAGVAHPNVRAVLEPPTESDGALWFAMELLVGLDLADTLAHERVLGPPRAVRIAVEAAEGLGAAHAAGVVHRDVKPENIFLVHEADGREAVKLLDFGFAWMPADEAAPGPGPAVVGTPEYMAPEQAQGGPARREADVYALGIVVYEMLAGRVPFVGPYPAIAHRHAEAPLPPIQALHPEAAISAELEAVVARALAKKPKDRFASMNELRRALLGTPEGERSTRGDTRRIP
jgi:serine/threonine-protein kinase